MFYPSIDPQENSISPPKKTISFFSKCINIIENKIEFSKRKTTLSGLLLPSADIINVAILTLGKLSLI